jgi:proteic killer suppression protein
MIVSIRHKGLRLYFEKGDASKLQPQHVSKINLIKGFWAVKVDKNYRIIFQFIAEDVHEVDYLDYH